MIESMEDILTARLKEIEGQLKFLRAEKTKTKQALDVFKGDGENNSQSRSTFAGEPIFKEKIKTALTKEFPNGATANDILKYVNEKWERQIVRSSLSPQLSRLKKEGIITLEDDIWKLAKNNSAPEVGADSNAGTLLNINHEPNVQNR